MASGTHLATYVRAPAAPGAAAGAVLGLLPVTADPHDRWVLATRIARRLGPWAWGRGGFASAAVVLEVGDLPPARPAVAVVLGALPPAGVVTTAPLLVVEIAPLCAPREWIERGTAEVWSVGADAAVVTTAEGRRRVELPAELRTRAGQRGPSLRLRLPIADADGGSGAIG